MNTISTKQLVVASVVLVVYFLLFGGELSAGIVLFGWVLFTRKVQSGRRESVKMQNLASHVNRAGAELIPPSGLPQRPMRRDYQTQRKLVR